MKRFEEYTPEDVEDLARECERLAEKNSELADENAKLWEVINGLVGALQCLAAIEEPAREIFTNLRRSAATPRKEPEESDSGFDLPF